MSVIANLDINLRGNTQGIEKSANTTTKKLDNVRKAVNSHASAVESRFAGLSHKIGGALSAIPGGHVVAGVLSPIVSFAGKIGPAFAAAVPGIGAATTAMGALGAATSFATGGLSILLAGVAASGAAAGAAGLAWVGMGRHASEGIDNLLKSADKIGTTTEALAGLRHAADLAGVDADTLDTSLLKMQRNLSEAADGGGSASKALQRLGLNASDLKGLNADLSFLQIADAIERVGDQSDRVALAMDIFGKSGTATLNLMREGSDGIKQSMQEAAEIGLTVTRKQAAEVEAANDAMQTMKSSFTGLFRTAAITIAPFVKMFADGITSAMKWVNSFRDTLLDWAYTAEFVFKNFGAYVNLYFDKALLKVVGWTNDFTNIFTSVLPTAIGEFINLLKPGFAAITDHVSHSMVAVANTVVHTFTEILPAVLSQWQDLMKASMLGDIEAVGRLINAVKSKMSRQEGDVERILREDAERSGAAFGRAFEQSMGRVRQSFQRQKGSIEGAMEQSVNIQQRMLDNQLQQFLKAKKAAINPKKPGEEIAAEGGHDNSAVERGSQEAFKIIAGQQGDKMLKAANDRLAELRKIGKTLDKIAGKPSGLAIGRGSL